MCIVVEKQSQRYNNNNNNSNYNFYHLFNGDYVLTILIAGVISKHYEIDLIISITDGIFRLQEVKGLAQGHTGMDQDQNSVCCLPMQSLSTACFLSLMGVFLSEASQDD